MRHPIENLPFRFLHISFILFRSAFRVIVDTCSFVFVLVVDRILYGSPSLKIATRSEADHKKYAIIMNGPSALKIEGRMNYYDYTLVANQFVKSQLYTDLRPTHYFLADADFHRKQSGEKAPHNDIIRLINEKTQWPLEIIMPTEARSNGVLSFIDNPYITMSFYGKERLTQNVLFAKSIFFNFASFPKITNVSILALAYALKRKAHRVDLYGVDLTAFKGFSLGDNRTSIVDKGYFFSGPKSEPHFQNTRKYQGRKNVGSLEFFEEIVAALRSHRELVKFAGCTEVVNMSDVSIVDAWNFHSD